MKKISLSLIVYIEQQKERKNVNRQNADYLPIYLLLLSGFDLSPLPLYFFLPNEKGIYLYLIMCCICLFIVTTNKIIQYTNSIGQNTGTSNTGKKVAKKPKVMDRMLAYQNLNSGKRLMNGLNSSLAFDGNVGSSASVST